MADLNTMLREAITTESRKRKCRWQTELEALGYVIFKDGSWRIRNPKTNRFIELSYNDTCIRTNNNRGIRFGRVWSRKNGYVIKPIECIDFVGLLNKNTIINVNYFDNWTNVDRLRDALCSRKSHSDNLKCAMSQYQNKIDFLTKEYQKKIEEAKRSYEWNVKYHTEGLARANENIAKIMNKSIDN